MFALVCSGQYTAFKHEWRWDYTRVALFYRSQLFRVSSKLLTCRIWLTRLQKRDCGPTTTVEGSTPERCSCVVGVLDPGYPLLLLLTAAPYVTDRFFFVTTSNTFFFFSSWTPSWFSIRSLLFPRNLCRMKGYLLTLVFIGSAVDSHETPRTSFAWRSPTIKK